MFKHKFIKIFLLFAGILISRSASVSAQNNLDVKYYDSSWLPITKDSAFYFTEIAKEGSIYRFKSYWMGSKKLRRNLAYSDTVKYKHVGASLDHYENGQLEDSTSYQNNGESDRYHYYENGKFWFHYTYDKEYKTKTSEAYDINGNKLENYVYETEAEFPGGSYAWGRYLQKNLNANVPVDHNAKAGTYKVLVRFIVDKDGTIRDAKAETNFGHGMEEEVLRIITNGPKWVPAEQNGRKVIAYRMQPVTFSVDAQ